MYYILNIEEYTIYLYPANIMEKDQIEEARHPGKPLKGPYSVRKDSPHGDIGQHHLHVYCKNNEIFSINRDGTAHDQSHGRYIPNKVADKLRSEFPDFHIPDDNFIESANMSYAGLIVEQILVFA